MHFSSCPQSFPASESFPMSQLFRQPKYWSFSINIRPSNEYSGLISFTIDWYLISLQSKGHSRVFSSTTVCLLWCLAFFMVQLSHPYRTTANKQTNKQKPAFTIWTFIGKVVFLLLKCCLDLSQFFFQRASFVLFFSFMGAVTILSDFGAQENQVCHCFHFFSIYLS